MSTDENETPEFNGFNTRASRRQCLSPKNKIHVNYLPLIDAKPSDPSTILTSMMKAQRLTNAKGQHWVIYTIDLQLYKVTYQIIWNDIEKLTAFIPRLGGVHFLMCFIRTVGAKAADSGLTEVLEFTLSGVAKMLSGKTILQNLRALRMLTEELLRELLQPDSEIKSMDDLEAHLDHLSEKSRAAKLWVTTITLPRGHLLSPR